jgi:signal transduction histidine kinase
MQAHGALGGRRLLLVEDDGELRSSLSELLLSDGYEVVEASNGSEALDCLRRAPAPDLILLDLMMPVKDGWQFRVEQKRDPAIASIPVVAFSADDTPKAVAIDAEAYIKKPFQYNSLVETVRRILDTKKLAHLDRMASLGTLAAGIAHEINNPLTYVIANLQTLAERLPVSSDRAMRDLGEIVSDALDGADRIRRLVRQVQMVSPGQHAERLSLVALRMALGRAVALTENQIKHRARLLCDLDQDAYVRGDAERIEQLFVNLLLNAAQAIPEGSAGTNRVRVGVRTLPGQNRALVEIEDSGVGIPIAVQERVFQPFFTTKPIGQGTGLGLSICRGIVTALGGQISFQSDGSTGTTFRVELPTTTGPA